jgi:hypothetical protein
MTPTGGEPGVGEGGTGEGGTDKDGTGEGKRQNGTETTGPVHDACVGKPFQWAKPFGWLRCRGAQCAAMQHDTEPVRCATGILHCNKSAIAPAPTSRNARFPSPSPAPSLWPVPSGT